MKLANAARLAGLDLGRQRGDGFSAAELGERLLNAGATLALKHVFAIAAKLMNAPANVRHRERRMPALAAANLVASGAGER
ncbi:hypothetical protein [Methylocella sp.]|uniref:hypothetical protein n=1 Tax=Methylocella sp. TaxID=1978226 RepID=UPI0035AF73EC